METIVLKPKFKIMKLSTTLVFNLVCFVALSQTCAPNNITTNPAAPVNTQRPSKLNTWDWTATDFTLNSSVPYNGNTSIRSPFFDTDNVLINGFYDPSPGLKISFLGLPRPRWCSSPTSEMKAALRVFRKITNIQVRDFMKRTKWIGHF